MSLVDISGVTLSLGKIPINGPVDISGITVVTDPSTGLKNLPVIISGITAVTDPSTSVKNLPVTVRDYTILSFTKQSSHPATAGSVWSNTYTTFPGTGVVLVGSGCILKTIVFSSGRAGHTAYVTIYDRNTLLPITTTATRDNIAPTLLFLIFYPQTKQLHLNHRFNNGIVMTVNNGYDGTSTNYFTGADGFTATGTYTLL